MLGNEILRCTQDDTRRPTRFSPLDIGIGDCVGFNGAVWMMGVGARAVLAFPQEAPYS